MNNEELTKQASIHLRNGDYDMFKTAFGEAGQSYIRRYVHEESFAEKILDVMTVTEDTPGVQRDTDSDTFYYLDEVEHGATAMQVSIRGTQEPRFVDGERYEIRIGKLETEPVKKKEMELKVAKNVLNMVKSNGGEALRRAQDRGFLSPIWEICKYDADSGDSSHSRTADWSSGPTKDVFVEAKSDILKKELMAARWLMAETTWNQVNKLDAAEIGDKAGDMLQDGMGEKTLLKMPVVTTIKSKLQSFDGDSMFYDSVTDTHYVYLFVEPEFIGRLIKFDEAHVWSKWEADLFKWFSWIYRGMGIGDIRGFIRVAISM